MACSRADPVTAIRLVDVSKSYGNLEVCRTIRLDIADREFVTLLGPSGCGKTTTLNMIAGLDEVSSGDILMDGRRVNDLEPVARDVAMVFQNYALYPHMTVAQNMGFNLRLRRQAMSEIDRKVGAAAAALDLDHLLERYPSQLSGGQQQRVAIGRAIVREPKVFLFDEPFSNLDAALRNRMRGEVRDLHSRLGVTSIFVTHDQEEALSISDRIAVMRQGAVEQFGTPEEVYARPATTYVARFIGNPRIEVLPAVLTEEAGVPLAVCGEARFALDSAQAARLRNHRGRIDLGLRPEHVALAETGIAATVRDVQPVGPSTLVGLTWNGGALTARLNGIVRMAPGTAVFARPDCSKLMFFDRADGRRIATSQ
jgi:ABC-type sugar transport system ATPase subunit